jgi:hypothetical protein
MPIWFAVLMKDARRLLSAPVTSSVVAPCSSIVAIRSLPRLRMSSSTSAALRPLTVCVSSAPAASSTAPPSSLIASVPAEIASFSDDCTWISDTLSPVSASSAPFSRSICCRPSDAASAVSCSPCWNAGRSPGRLTHRRAGAGGGLLQQLLLVRRGLRGRGQLIQRGQHQAGLLGVGRPRRVAGVLVGQGGVDDAVELVPDLVVGVLLPSSASVICGSATPSSLATCSMLESPTS